MFYAQPCLLGVCFFGHRVEYHHRDACKTQSSCMNTLTGKKGMSKKCIHAWVSYGMMLNTDRAQSWHMNKLISTKCMYDG